MSYDAWQDLLDEPVTPEAPAQAKVSVGPSPAEARRDELARAEALSGHPELKALLQEQRRIEADIAALGATAEPSTPVVGYQRPMETAETRLARRKAEVAACEARLEGRRSRPDRVHAPVPSRPEPALRPTVAELPLREGAIGAGIEAPRVGGAAWRMAARNVGSPAWQRQQALAEVAALEARLGRRVERADDVRPRPLSEEAERARRRPAEPNVRARDARPREASERRSVRSVEDTSLSASRRPSSSPRAREEGRRAFVGRGRAERASAPEAPRGSVFSERTRRGRDPQAMPLRERGADARDRFATSRDTFFSSTRDRSASHRADASRGSRSDDTRSSSRRSSSDDRREARRQARRSRRHTRFE